MEVFKPIANQVACNTTPSTIGNAKLVRVINTGGGVRNLIYTSVIDRVNLTINASANGTTLLTLSPQTQTIQGIQDTSKLKIGYKIVASSNTAVVNTNVASEITAIVNSSAFIVNVDIIIANGECSVGASNGEYTTAMAASEHFVVEKNAHTLLASNNAAAEVLATPIAYKN